MKEFRNRGGGCGVEIHPGGSSFGDPQEADLSGKKGWGRGAALGRPRWVGQHSTGHPRDDRRDQAAPSPGTQRAAILGGLKVQVED